MKLSDLVENLPFLEKRHFSDLDIMGIASHSKEVEPGFLFVAIYGTLVDGHQFIKEALDRGAAAVLVEKEVAVPKRVPFFRAEDSRAALSHLAARWFGHPSRDLPLIGVTGTNGKTTITYLLEHMLKTAGKKTAVMGTISTRFDGKEWPSSHTTPESLHIHRSLAEMKKSGVESLVMEVSSHAVDMRRVEDLAFDAVLFTNLSPEHLDYHKTMELYFEAKKRLFTQLLRRGKGEKRAIVNADDRYGMKLIEVLSNTPLWTFSTRPQSKWNFFVKEWHSDLSGMRGVLATPAGEISFQSPLIGQYNLSNILAATAGALSFHIPVDAIAAALANFPGVPGRLERIANDRGLHVFVDYAHTPDALKNVLSALKQLDPPKLWTVFGCGGDRDRSKRPIMGREVARLANFAVVTSDNPRTEDPEKIIREILPGVEEGGMTLGNDCWVEVDRRKAIATALTKAGPGEVVLIAGKGHEDYQILGTQKTHFDDREVAREILANSPPL
jgi:UDP-N-acetylmuramyl-tripeptide synthetase